MACSSGIISALFWRKEVCYSHNKSLLDGLYLFVCIKDMSLSVCDKHVLLLAPSLHLVNALSSELRLRIELIWTHRDYFSNIMTFVQSHPGWFLNTLLFI